MSRRDPHSYCDPDQAIIEHIDLKLKIDFSSQTLRGTARLDFHEPTEKTPFDLDTRALTIEKIEDNKGASLPYRLHAPEGFMGSRLTVELPESCTGIAVHYKTSPRASALQWLEPQLTAGGRSPFVFSQCQPHHARSILPVQDSPLVRFTYDAELDIPEDLTAVMSAAPGLREPAPDSLGRKQVRFEMPQPIPAYLFAFAAGNLDSVDLGPRCRVYAESEYIAAAAYEFAEAEQMLSAAEELFGPYRWQRFDILLMPPSFPYGGMENPRLTFLTPTLLAKDRSLVNVLAHELAHSWTGNLVTNATMNDFWINEGFTVWAERRILEALYGPESSAIAAALGRSGLNQELERFADQPSLTHLQTNLAGVDPDSVYSLVPYEKGFLFVLTMEKAVGRKKFDEFIRRYIERFAFTSITTKQLEDFLDEQLPGLRENVEADAWIHGPGIPENASQVKSKALDEVLEAAAAWIGGKRIGKHETNHWDPQLWQVYLHALPKKISEEDCRYLDDTFAFSRADNAEILAAWFVIAASSGYRPSFSAIDAFLGHVGRMKFLKPIYAALAGRDDSIDFAEQVYQKHKSGYHPIAAQAVESILPKKA